MFGVVDYMCGFHYDIISRRFKNSPDEDIHYGWEEEPTQASMSFEEPANGMPFGLPTEDEAPF
jgi:hypothetical protein